MGMPHMVHLGGLGASVTLFLTIVRIIEVKDALAAAQRTLAKRAD
eukprot:gene25729-35923_t